MVENIHLYSYSTYSLHFIQFWNKWCYIFNPIQSDVSKKRGGDFPLLPYYDTNCLNLSTPITIFDYVVLSWSSHQRELWLLNTCKDILTPLLFSSWSYFKVLTPYLSWTMVSSHQRELWLLNSIIITSWLDT